MTRDGGATWNNVTPKGLKETLVNAIDISPHDPGTVFIATTRYKFNDKTPSIWKTTDYGKTWKNITGNIPSASYTRVIRQDTEDPELLFTGTETGVFVSFNGGARWEPLQLNLPITPILDLKVAHNDLIVATSGRSFWILDDIEILRQEKPDNADLYVYKSPEVVMSNGRSELDGSGDKVDGVNALAGVNPASGAVIYYQLPKKPDSVNVEIIIKDHSGEIVRTFSSIKDSDFKPWDGGPPAKSVLNNKEGLNRHVWDLRHETMPGVEGVYIEGSYRGHKVSPGTYTITVRSGDHESSNTVTLTSNPLYSTTTEDYQEYDQFMKKVEKNLTEMHQKVTLMEESKETLENVLEKIPTTEQYSDLRKNVKEVISSISAWDEDMVQRKSKAYDDVENFPNKFTANYIYAINATESSLPRVNQGSRDRIKELDGKWETLESKADEIINQVLPKINKDLWEAGIGALILDRRA